MRESKNPSVTPDPDRRRRLTEKNTFQLGRLHSSTEWMLLSSAATLAREEDATVLTGYFSINSKEVKSAK